MYQKRNAFVKIIYKCHSSIQHYIYNISQLYFDLTKVDIQFVEDGYVDGLERRLRACIEQHKNLLLGMTVDEEVSRRALISQIVDQVGELNTKKYSFDELSLTNAVEGGHFITLVSVDVPVDDVHALLRSIIAKNGRVDSFVRNILDCNSPEDILTGSHCPDREFVPNTHVTLAHCRSVAQSEMHKIFGQLEGCSVLVRPKAFLWNQQVAALEVILEGSHSVKSFNDFVHITTWVRHGSSAVAANSLPQQVNEGKANFLDVLDAPTLSGRVSFKRH